MKSIKISDLPESDISLDEVTDVAVLLSNNTTRRISVYSLLYDFAFDLYGHEATAKKKVESYLKSKNGKQ